MAGEAILGREAELDAVERFIAAMAAGPSALVIEGEPGIGKTTLWLEAVRAAEARSYRVLQARPAESEAKLSYAALADLVGGIFDETRAVLPGVQEHALAAALLRIDTDEPADPRTTAAALVGVLTTLAAERPVLVAVDDVQWLDRASERALAFAARRLPPALGMVLTRRGEGGEDPPLGLGRALPDERLEHLMPGPLALASLHHLIRSRLGVSPPRPLLARVAGASGGNPFFALELARALVEDRDDRLLGDPLPVPRSLLDLVAARLRRLSPAAREAVLIAASVSRPTVTLVVDALAPGSDAVSALVEAEEAGVVFSEHGRLRFAHPVLASVVYGSASEERRRRLHRRLAKLVVDPEDRAHHLAQSTLQADEAIAAEVERVAGRAAVRGAQDTAAELFEAACRLTPPHRKVELARRSIDEANALLAIGEGAGARSCAVRAVEASGSSPLRAEALSLLGSIDWAEGEMISGTSRVEQALVAAADDRELRGRLYAKLARVSVLVDPKRAVERAAAASRLLSEERAPELLAGALIDRFFAEAMLGRGARQELFERGLELEARAGHAVERHPIPMVWFHFTDDFDAARARHAEEERLARERGWEVWRADMLGHLGMAELRAGRWELAEKYIEESCSGLVQGEAHGPAAMRFAWRSYVDAHRGRTERARATLVSLIEQFERAEQEWWTAMSLSALGFVEFAAGDHEAADRALTRMRELIEPIGVKDAPLDRSEPFHIEALLALGELARARDTLGRLEWRGRTLPRLWIATTLPRARALVLAAEGEVGGALAVLDDLDVNAAGRLPFELARTLLVRGQLHRRSKQKRAAGDAFRQALEIFEQLGAPTWAEQTRRELERVRMRQRSPDQLTSTELRVAELAAGGMTNREVAAAAFMSPKTVEANLARVYRKLGIRSRAELGARIAAKDGDAAPRK
jgi:DNA-binding CsgD family transcriptional regulator